MRLNSASSAGRASFPLQGAPDQQLVDPPPIEIDNLELPTLFDKALALTGQMPEHGEREPGHGGVITVLGQIDAEPLGKRIDRHLAGDEQRAIITLDH